MKNSTQRLLNYWIIGIAALVSAALVSPSSARAKKKEKVVQTYLKGGKLFISSRAFPTEFEDLNDLIKKGRRHHRRTLRWSRGTDLEFYFLLVLPKTIRTHNFYLVLYYKGKSDYLDAQEVAVRGGKLQFLTSTVTFSGSYLKKGRWYQLRAVVVSKRGKVRYEKILAKVNFKIK